LSVVLLLTAVMVTAKRDKDRIASERLIQADEAAAEPKDGDKVIAQAANDCYEGNGSGYRGRKATTVSGRKCQNWNSQTPHKHKWTPEKYPKAGLVANYCRLAGWTGGLRPWCYTMEKGKRWEYCDIPKCQDIDECAPNPCKHGACQDKLNDFTCACDAGWKGKTCEQNIDDCAKDPCKHGTCQDGLNEFTCTCDPGWEGKLCDKDIDDCSKDPCKHGTCQDGLNDFICTCDPGWEGKLCDKELTTSHVESICTSWQGKRQLSIACPTPDATMRVVDAYYGWSKSEADCHAVEGDTYCRINENDVAQRCDGLNSCQFWADAAGWRMGCSGYHDFLQVHYICVRSGELTSNIRAKSGLTKMMQKEDRASLETDDGMRMQMDTMKADISSLKAAHEAMKKEQGSLKAQRNWKA